MQLKRRTLSSFPSLCCGGLDLPGLKAGFVLGGGRRTFGPYLEQRNRIRQNARSISGN